MSTNPLRKLQQYGQSVWLDFLSRNLIRSGQLQKLIDADGLTGMTSNPAIFEKAISGSADYDSDIRALLEKDASPSEIYETLAVADIREAADHLRPIYDRTGGMDGYVSLEVSPKLAYDMQATVYEAKRLWSEVERPNVMIKIPGTRQGLPAISECIAEGININVTLLFGLPRYKEVVDAYLRGLERRVNGGLEVRSVRSVASFFLSRIDTLLDPQLEAAEDAGAKGARELRGRVAIASAKLAYEIYQQVFSETRFQNLERRGARKQWLLWASTSTKNPEYSDVKYVEELIGPETINTMPLETIEAYRDHGDPAPRLQEDVDGTREVMNRLAGIGINIDEITQKLEDEGVEKFVKPFDKLLRGIRDKASSLQPSR